MAALPPSNWGQFDTRLGWPIFWTLPELHMQDAEFEELNGPEYLVAEYVGPVEYPDVPTLVEVAAAVEFPDFSRPLQPSTGGRPTTYDPTWHPEMAKRMGMRGYSFTQIAVCFKVKPRTLDDWADRHPEFCEAYEEAYNLRYSFVEANVAGDIMGRPNKGMTGAAVSILGNMKRKAEMGHEYRAPKDEPEKVEEDETSGIAAVMADISLQVTDLSGDT